MLSWADLAAQVRAAVLPPPPDLKVSDWADEFRVLSPESSGEPGRWRTDRAPYQRGIMDALSDPAVEQVTVMSSAQVGKTEFVNNAVGYFIHQDPSPVMVVQPTVDAAKKWSKTRLAPMLRDTPVLRERVAEARGRDDSNTLQEKTFPGGLLVIVGSNAPAGLSSQPIRVVLCDEVDRFEESAGTEGDPVDLAFKRTTTFTGRRKHVLISTPGTKGVSRIEKAWAESDQRHFQVPCPHCGAYQPLEFSRLVWPEDDPGAAGYACRDCGALSGDGQKPAMLRAGRWVAERPQVTDHAGFHLNELYSPWRRFGDVAKDFLKAKKRGVRSLQVWINTALGEPWDPRDSEGLSAKGLMARREVYPAEVPAGVLLLTAGIDVQDDRLEMVVKGWGASEESWTIAHHVMVGNPALVAPWQELEAHLLKAWQHENGGMLRILGAGIDYGGHFSRQVVAFCRPRAGWGVFALKGAAPGKGKVIRRAKGRSGLWILDVNAIKDTVAARLRVEAPGPGYCHFSHELGQDYFDQLTAEKPVRRRSAGQDVRIWEKIIKGARNEALDCEVYAAAALERLGVQDWDGLTRRAAGATLPAPPPRPAVAPPAAPPDVPGVIAPPADLTPQKRAFRPRAPMAGLGFGGGGWRRGDGSW